MSITDGEILRVVASLLWPDGNVNQNVFNAVVTGGGAPWADEDIVDDAVAWCDAMYANLATQMSDQIDGNVVHVYKYDAIDDDWDEVGSAAWTFNPTNSNDQLPRGVAALINLWTSDPDVQGKKYIGAITEGTLTGGLFTAGLITALLAFGADWLGLFVGGTSGATWSPGVWSVAGTVFKLAVDHISAGAIASYQRRRKRGVGI